MPRKAFSPTAELNRLADLALLRMLLNDRRSVAIKLPRHVLAKAARRIVGGGEQWVDVYRWLGREGHSIKRSAFYRFAGKLVAAVNAMIDAQISDAPKP